MLAMTVQDDHAERVFVIGLGVTGLSCVRHLRRQGRHCVVVDSRHRPPALAQLRREHPEVELRLGRLDDASLADAEAVLLSPGLDPGLPVLQRLRQRGLRLEGDVEWFARQARAPVVAITGSNGKSTVTHLLGLMMEQAGREARVGGNIGVPALDLLQYEEPDFYVLELSSFQLELTHSLAPAAAVVLNLSPDHLDRYASMADYARAKQTIYRYARRRLVNLDDTAVTAMLAGQVPDGGFTLGEPPPGCFGLARRQGRDWLMFGQQTLLAASELKIPGRHNRANALAALALGHAVGLPFEAMVAALRQFAGLPHRCQWVARIDEVDWYNDSKATNVGATVAAVEGLDRSLVLIAGGEGKGADFSALRQSVSARARAVVLLGRDAPAIAAALEGCVRLVRVADMDEAVARARELARPGDAVLLSPACASFDMFEDYRQRGEAFVAAVEALGP